MLKDQIQGLGSKIEELEAELFATEYGKQAITKDNERFRGLIHQLEQEKGRSERALINEQQLSAMVRVAMFMGIASLLIQVLAVRLRRTG